MFPQALKRIDELSFVSESLEAQDELKLRPPKAREKAQG
jgi:hypothetical protein